jgi:hypothetical protein
VSTVTRSDGWVMWSCDHPACDETVEFRPTLEETAVVEVSPDSDEPAGWRLDITEDPGKDGGPPWHFCPQHAG